ncbi:MAG: TrkH family potassium uptake protein [Candidatus Saganbacteria bacterium]|nr:TrkH family potassium uptake protein [Candidatus Saganbacteria bacterium]
MFKIRPSIVIAVSFFIVILAGALLLQLPISSSNGTFTKFLDSYFTANSATCVTGLVCLDTGVHFSFFGQFIILLLIQIGGLGYMTFSTFLVLLFRKKMFITEKIAVQEALNIHSTNDVINVVKRIFGIVFVIEGAGALILFLRWLPELGLRHALWYSIFHSVSAFCNAGFALPANFANLTAYKADIVVNLTITSLIILGGLGFLVIADIIQNRRFSLQSKTVIATTAFLIISGTLAIFAMEFNNLSVMGGLSVGGKFLSSYFQAVTPRTAGFNTLDIGHLSHTTLLLMMGLMFIGASPGGTGGGIKTTTFALITWTIIATLKNNKNTVLFDRKIPAETIRRAFVIFFLSIIVVACAVFMLNGIEKFSLMEIAFEVFSAFGTVGLSTGITPFLSDAGKIVIISVMFIGRVGALTLLAALSGHEGKHHIEYPKEGISIG